MAKKKKGLILNLNKKNKKKKKEEDEKKTSKRGGVVISQKAAQKKKAGKKANESLKKAVNLQKEEKYKSKETNKYKAAIDTAQHTSALGTRVEKKTGTVKVKGNDGKTEKVKYEYEPMTMQDYGKMEVGARTGRLKETLNSDKKLKKKVTDLNVKDYAEGALGMGMMDQMTQGLSVSEDPTYKYSKDQKKIINAQKQTGKYMAGRVVGGMAEFGLGGTNALGSSLAKTATKSALREAAKKGTKELAKAKAKNITKEVGTDLFVSAGLNTLDAVKFAYKDGKIDKDALGKELAFNFGGELLIGGAVSSIRHSLSAKQVARFTAISNKKAKGQAVSEAEQKFYDKHVREVAEEVRAKLQKTKQGDKQQATKSSDVVEKPVENTVEQVAKAPDETPIKTEQPQKEEPTVSKTETVEQPKAEVVVNEEDAQKLARLSEQKAYAEQQRSSLQAKGENVEHLDRAIAKYDSQINEMSVPQEAKDSYINNARADREQANKVFNINRELEPLRKEHKTLKYKIENTTGEKQTAYMKRERELADQIEELEEQIAVKNPETDEDWDKLIAHAEHEAYKDLPSKTDNPTGKSTDNTAKVTGRKKRETKPNSPIRKIWRTLVNDFDAFENFAKTLDGEERSEFLSLINNLRLAENRSRAWISNARTNLDRQVIGKSLKEILGDYTSKANAEKYSAFNDFLYHRHNVARAEQGKPVFGEEITAADSAKIAREILEEYPEFLAKQQEIVQYFRDLQQVRVDGGLISEDLAKTFDDMYQDYVPTYRVQDGEAFDSMHVKYTVKNGINRATGSNKDLLYIHEQAALVTEQTFKSVEANQMLQAYAKYGGFDVEAINKGNSPEDVIQSGTYLNDDKTVTFWENGEAKKVAVTDEMYEGLKSWSGLDRSEVMNWKLTQVTGTLNRNFKRLITDWNPLFAVTNGAKDFQDALFYSKDTVAFMKSLPKALKSIAKKDDYYKAYVANGGKYTSFFDVTTDFNADKIFDKANPLKWIENLNSTIEVLPRMTEFVATIDKRLAGADLTMASKKVIDEAMYNANDITLNFGRSGKWGRMMNQTIVPYFNPGIQGFDKLMRTFTDDGLKSVLHMGLKASSLFVPALVLNEVMNRKVEGYGDLNSRDKDLYYLIPLGEQRWIKIPKSRTGSTLTSPIQHLFNSALYETPYETVDLFKLMMNNSAPANPLENNLLSPIFNVKNNRTWWGGDIEYSSDKELPVNERYDENTSKISIWLGQNKLAQELNLSPKKINVLLDGYIGVIGDFVLPWTASASKTNPAVSKFVLDGIFSNRLSTDFWEKSGDLKMQSESRHATDKDIEAYSKFGALYSRDAANLSTAISDIQNSDMSKKEKAEKVRAIRAELNKIYRAGSRGEAHNIDPVNVVAKQLGFDKALANYSIPRGKEAYEQFTAIEELEGKDKKTKEKKAKEFYKTYSGINSINNKLGWEKRGYPESDTIAVGCALTKASENVYEAWNVQPNKKEIAQKYVKTLRKAGDTDKQIINRYTVTTKAVEKGLEGVGTEAQCATAMALATSKTKFADVAYYIKSCDSKMNAARGLNKHGWSTKKIGSLYKQLDGSTKKADIQEVIDAQDCSREEKAMLFNVLAPKNYKNPYGSIGDYSVSRDYGVSDSDSSSSSSGGGSGGGSDSGKGKKSDLPSWEDWVKDYLNNETTTIKYESVKLDRWDSPLDSAYRKKITSLNMK